MTTKKSGTKNKDSGRKTFIRPEATRSIEEIKDPAVRAMATESLIDEMQAGPPKAPFTRFELPDDVEVVMLPKAFDSVVVYKDHKIHMFICKDLNAARQLQSELITSLELLNFYIQQVEKDGKIRYTR